MLPLPDRCLIDLAPVLSVNFPTVKCAMEQTKTPVV